MEISLLLSAAQSSNTDATPHSMAPSSLSTSPVSTTIHADNRFLDLPSLDDIERRHRPETRALQLPSFSRLTSAGKSSLYSTRHGRIEKALSSKPFQCTVNGCNATFGQKGSLTRHIKSRHEKLRPHTCDVCQKSFSALWTLRVHQRNVHLKSKPHKCHLCSKSFGELFNKSKHIAIVHEGKRPFTCPICSRAFGYKGDMRKHVMELHEQTGRPFQCMIPSCGVKFARRRYLRRHENLSHKGDPMLANRGASSTSHVSPGYVYLPQPRPDSFYVGQATAALHHDASMRRAFSEKVEAGLVNTNHQHNSPLRIKPDYV